MAEFSQPTAAKEKYKAAGIVVAVLVLIVVGYYAAEGLCGQAMTKEPAAEPAAEPKVEEPQAGSQTSAEAAPDRGRSYLRAPLRHARSGAGTVECNGRMYVIGGFQYNPVAWLDSVESYDPASNSWREETPMPTPRANVACATYRDEIYVFGGTSANCGPEKLATVEVYNTRTHTWRSGPALPKSRVGATAVTVDDKIYVIGGQTAYSLFCRVDVFDVSSGLWTRGPDLSATRCYAAAATLAGRVVVMGGESQTPERNAKGQPGLIYDQVEILEPGATAWRTGAPLPVPCSTATATVLDNVIYLFGGYGTNGQMHYRHVFAGDGDQWQTMAPLQMSRAYAGAATVDGRIFVAGGAAGPYPSQRAEMEEYDPTAAAVPVADAGDPAAGDAAEGRAGDGDGQVVL
ncbi:MAG TPA: kelch repeat-containing protein [bacterium]|nr:kelch repeat-containing protein [bacterium]